MSASGIIFTAGLTLVILLLILGPFFTSRGERNAQDVQTLTELRVQYDRILTNIRDLDEDHAIGKLEQDVYGPERSRLVAQGVALLKQIDERSASVTGEATDTAIEEAIAARRKKQQQ